MVIFEDLTNELVQKMNSAQACDRYSTIAARVRLHSFKIGGKLNQNKVT